MRMAQFRWKMGTAFGFGGKSANEIPDRDVSIGNQLQVSVVAKTRSWFCETMRAGVTGGFVSDFAAQHFMSAQQCILLQQ